MSTDRRGWVVGLGAAGAGLLVTCLAGVVAAGMSWSAVVSSYTLTNTVIGVGFLASGLLIAGNRPDNRLGWLLVVCGLGHLVTAATGPVGLLGLAAGWPEVATRSLASPFLIAWQLGIIGLFPLALLLFPDGRLPGPRWRPVAVLVLVQMSAQVVLTLLSPDPATSGRATVSILSVGLEPPEPVLTALNLVNVAILVLVLASLVVRYRRGTELVRRQLLWLILAVLAMGLINGQRWYTGDGPILLLLTFVLVPVAIAIAVVRHQLLDIRLVVSRAVLYLVVSATLIAGYAGLVAALSLLVPGDADRTLAALAALAVAFAFAPVHAVAQRLVDRAFFGERADALAAAAGVAGRLAPGADVGTVLEQVRLTLRFPTLVLHRGRGEPVVAGAPRDDVHWAELPLADAGSLRIGLRRGEQTLHLDDHRLLTLVGGSLLLAWHSADLTGQVRASRTALVGAHAEERLRLHRELHDGLGPLLTGAAYRADAARNVLATDPVTAERLVREVRAEVGQAIDGVRRVVYGLRPLELEQHGLLGALRERLADTTRHDGAQVAVDLQLPDELGPMPAAVEVAAFRIVVEAVTNVRRHSTAERCVVRLLSGPGRICVEITDDGAGSDPWVPGVGLLSLLARAEELGGAGTAGPTPQGGRVTAELPC